MDIREFLERQKKRLAPVVFVVILVSFYFTYRSLTGDVPPAAIDRIYFSDDDGESYFADDVAKGFTFDHNGKTAYRAFVYRCGSGSPFVGLLVREAGTGNPTAKVASDPKNKVDPKAKGSDTKPPAAIEIRKPKDSKWVLANSPSGQRLISSLCPDGSSPDAIFP